jgi:predicted permease
MERWYRRPFNRVAGPNPIRDIDDEMRFHIEMRVQELVKAGETEERARELALQRFGEVATPREECIDINQRRGRRMARADYFSELRQDIGYALRALRRRPAFSIIAVLTLALGIGANTAIFSVVYGVLLQPLPMRSSDELVRITTQYPDGGQYPLSAPDFMSIGADNHVFTGVAAGRDGQVTMTAPGDPREVQFATVSNGFFDLLGLPMKTGRTFGAEDHVPGGARVALITDAFAEEMFGREVSPLGKSLTLNGNPFTIIGVVTSGIAFPEGTQVYTPIRYDSTYSATTAVARRSESLTTIARMKPGVTVAAAEAEMKRIGSSLDKQFAQTNQGLTFSAQSLSEVLLGPVKQPLFVLLGAVGLVLLIACANVANLLLARASTRETELAVRAALGAGRGRLVRQLLTESMVLALAGALFGIALAWWGTHTLVAAQPANIPRLNHIGLNPIVLGFTGVIAIITGVLFGSVPAMQSTGGRLMNAIRDGGRGTLSGKGGQRLRASVVIAELALAVVLLTSAGLLIRSFHELTRVQPGFNPSNAVTFRIATQGSRYPDAVTRINFYTQLQQKLAVLPGVTSVGASNGMPMSGLNSIIGPFKAETREVPKGVQSEIWVTSVTPTYFDAIGARIMRGRAIDDHDRIDSPPVGVVNRAAIARWFPDGDPVGERVLLGSQPIEIVGVVEDFVQESPSDPVLPQLFLPYVQNVTSRLNFVLRGPGDLTGLTPRIREAVHQLDPQLPFPGLDPLGTVVTRAMSRPRFYTTLMVLFAGIAITLAMVGIFGVMNYLVTQRSREISVRMALGADRMRVIRMVVGNAMIVATAGLALGIAGAIAAGGLLRSQLFGIGVVDPLTIASVTLLLALSAAIACFLPARRAATLDPGDVLRG